MSQTSMPEISLAYAVRTLDVAQFLLLVAAYAHSRSSRPEANIELWWCTGRGYRMSLNP